MIEYTKGNLLEANAEALVNTVNCVGVMGKGIALQFKQAFPENFTQYQKACNAELLKPGKMLTYFTGSLFGLKYIINFPTKRHWKGKSQLEDIDLGLKSLVEEVRQLEIKSIAIPPLGCGNGGLNWNDVKQRIEAAFLALPDVAVYLYEPSGAPDVERMTVNTKKPALTKARALFVMLMDEYGVPGYKLTKLEIQKLAYFLQEAGEPLKLNFVKSLCGPYAENLNHVLQRLEGHYIKGYGDRTQEAHISLTPSAAEEAKSFLEREDESLTRLEQVKGIIYGYETPYGVELLSTVHWIMKHNPEKASDVEFVIENIRSWNERKCNLFKPEHIKKAWAHLNKHLAYNKN
jgi:O-acetyl-ADP-ribose deacetylase (regulator of RNase III)